MKPAKESAVRSMACTASSSETSHEGDLKGLTLIGIARLLAGVNTAIRALLKNSSCTSTDVPCFVNSSGSPLTAKEEMSPWGSTIITGILFRTASSITHLHSTVLPDPLPPRAIKCRLNAWLGKTTADPSTTFLPKNKEPSVRICSSASLLNLNSSQNNEPKQLGHLLFYAYPFNNYHEKAST